MPSPQTTVLARQTLKKQWQHQVRRAKVSQPLWTQPVNRHRRTETSPTPAFPPEQLLHPTAACSDVSAGLQSPCSSPAGFEAIPANLWCPETGSLCLSQQEIPSGLKRDIPKPWAAKCSGRWLRGGEYFLSYSPARVPCTCREAGSFLHISAPPFFHGQSPSSWQHNGHGSPLVLRVEVFIYPFPRFPTVCRHSLLGFHPEFSPCAKPPVLPLSCFHAVK